MSAVPVFADNDGDVYYIPMDRMSAWHYWNNHITDIDQEILLDDSEGNLNSHVTRTVTYNISSMNASDQNNLFATLQSGGCTWTVPETNSVKAVCPAVAIGGYTYSKFQEDNHTTLLHELPLLKGTITQPSSYSGADSVFLNTGKTFVVALYIQGYVSITNQLLNVYYSDGSSITVQGYFTSFQDDSLILGFSFTNNDIGKWATISIPFLDGKTFPISPIFFGELESASDETLSILRYDTNTESAIKEQTRNIQSYITGQTNSIVSTINSQTNTLSGNITNQTESLGNKLNTGNGFLESISNYLNTGNPSTSSVVYDNDYATSVFDTTSSAYISSESAAVDNMENGLQNISTSSDLLSSSKFIQSANWVTNQFNRLVTGTPFELVITFALVLGIALVFIGKVK